MADEVWENQTLDGMGGGGGGSTILNHGFLLYIIQCVYDPAFS